MGVHAVKRRDFLRYAALGAAALVLPRWARAAAPSAARPNFLLMIADDLNLHDLGCAGNPDVKTPNLDRLASEGMTLRGMYSPAPTCSPCRHALYTGLFPIRSGAYPNHTRAYDGTASIFTHLKTLGYRVGLQGKTHVGPPATFPWEYIHANPDNAEAFAAFITRDKSQPWLAVLASHDPHTPWTRGPKDLYKPEVLKIPPYLHDNAVTRKNLADYYAEITQLDAQVGACLKAVEESGQAGNTLVLFVSEQGSSFPYGGKWSLYENGIRIFAFARWPGRIKPGSSSDALMEYVDVPPTFLEAAGADPTKIDTGCPDANGQRSFDGRSFLGVLLGKTGKLRDYVFAQHTTVGIIGYKEPYPMRSVCDGRYKLVRNLAPGNTYWITGIHGTGIFKSWEEDAAKDPKLAERVQWLSHRPAEELYDLQADPYDMKNLAEDPKCADIKARLARELDAWMAQQGDKGMETELKAKSRQGRGEDPDAGTETKGKKAGKAGPGKKK
jgi:N-sulfoglucosamine sulfohydrolase